MILPVFRRFEAGGFTFTDLRLQPALRGGVALAARSIQRRAAVEAQGRGEDVFCEVDASGVLGPDAEPPESDSECDSRLGVVEFEVRRGGDAGGFVLYNVEVLEEDEERIEAAAYASPALPFRGDFDLLAVQTGEVMRDFLDLNLLLVDGRVFDLVEWRFPTDDPKRRWGAGGVSNLGFVHVVRGLGGGADVTELPKGDGSIPLRSIRRRRPPHKGPGRPPGPPGNGGPPNRGGPPGRG